MLHNFDPHNFLANHWQKSPCIIKNAFTQPPAFVTADELAGFALEEEIESRIIRNDNNQWQLFHGPFDEADFSELPESHWTLLVQTLDYWFPDINQLLAHFRFIPRWRFDDVMVSFATNHGGVGPHFDNYDVFLIQAEGERRWRVGKMGDTGAQQTKIDGLLHLAEFEPIIDVIMQPGDMLYIPPDTPHWGESIGESIGYSVGYRAPQTRDLLALLAEHFEQSATNEFFTDSYRCQPNYSNEIEPELYQWAKRKLQNIANNQELIESLLSQFLTSPKIAPVAEHQQLADRAIKNILNLKLAPGVNCSWFKTDDKYTLTIEGESYCFTSNDDALVKQLAAGEVVDFKGLAANSREFAFYETLSRIVDRGYFLFNI